MADDDNKITPPMLYTKGDREALERKVDGLGSKIDTLVQQFSYRTIAVVALTVSVVSLIVALILAVRR
jgi:hypothetical protein